MIIHVQNDQFLVPFSVRSILAWPLIVLFSLCKTLTSVFAIFPVLQQHCKMPIGNYVCPLILEDPWRNSLACKDRVKVIRNHHIVSEFPKRNYLHQIISLKRKVSCSSLGKIEYPLEKETQAIHTLHDWQIISRISGARSQFKGAVSYERNPITFSMEHCFLGDI